MTIEYYTNQERNRAKDFKLIKEYENYYLYGKYKADGTLLYRECFSKFDIDGIPERQKPYNLWRKYGWR